MQNCWPAWQSCGPNPPEVEDIPFLPMRDLLQYFRRRQVTPTQAVQAYAERIERINPLINAFVLTQIDKAMEQAHAADQRYIDGTARKFEGLPIATKDLFDWEEGVRNTFGSRVFKERYEFLPPADAIYIQRLFEQGAISLGKTATPEFGHKGITASPAWGDTSTPFRIGFNAGGSSGGSAAAAAAFLVASTEGSDAGGSVRIPAAPCGVVGFKPSYNRITQGVPPFPVNPLLHVGPIDRTVYGAAVLADTMSVPYSPDPFGQLKPLECERNLEAGVRGLRIGYTLDWDIYPVEDEVKRVIDDNICAFETAGATVEPVHLGLSEAMMPIRGRPVNVDDVVEMFEYGMGSLYAGSIVNYFGAMGIDVMYDPSVLTPKILELINLGFELKATDIRDVESDSQAIRDTFAALWSVNDNPSGYDLIVGPTIACLPQRLPNAGDGSTVGPSEINGIPINPQLGWCCTALQNWTGDPAVSVPAGCYDGMPVGMQIVGARGCDEMVMAAARVWERVRPWYDRLPRDL